MPQPAITRQQFTEAIEAGIEHAAFDEPAAEALRRVAREASEFTVGTFKNCPITQAGLFRPHYREREVGYFAFIFDDAIRRWVKRGLKVEVLD